MLYAWLNIVHHCKPWVLVNIKQMWTVDVNVFLKQLIDLYLPLLALQEPAVHQIMRWIQVPLENHLCSIYLELLLVVLVG